MGLLNPKERTRYTVHTSVSPKTSLLVPAQRPNLTGERCTGRTKRFLTSPLGALWANGVPRHQV